MTANSRLCGADRRKPTRSACIRSTSSCWRCPTPTWRRTSTAISASTSRATAIRWRSRPSATITAGARSWRAKTKALHHLSFGCYAEDLPRLKARIEGNGVKLIDPPPGFESNGFWFRNHENVLIEVKVAPKVSPDSKSRKPMDIGAGRRRRRRDPRKDWPPVRPRRLSHVLIFTRDVDASIEFYERNLGLRLSDRAGRSGRLHARHPRQRPSSAGAGEIVGARLPPLQLGRCQHQRHRARRHAHGRQGLDQGLGPGPPRARLELFPLRARSVGQLLGIFLRYRLHPQGAALAGGRPQAGGFVLSLGSRSAARVHHQLSRAARVADGETRHSTTIFTFVARLDASWGPSPLSTRKRSSG